MKCGYLGTVLLLPSVTLATFLWPIPQSIERGDVDLNLANSFHIRGPNIPELQEAIRRYTDLITDERWVPVHVPLTKSSRIAVAASSLATLTIDISDTTAELAFGVDESYRLDITKDGKAALEAKTVWGALRGLETFSQLIQSRTDETDDDIEEEEEEEYTAEEEEKKTPSFEGLFIPDVPIHIKDAPASSFDDNVLRQRSNLPMVDTSRNFFSVEAILRTLDAMAYNKLNVFHWHITDSHSFPIALDTMPQLAQRGAYKLHGKRLVYKKRDVQRIVKYARDRGIRVIPEIDMPAHTGSWALAYPDIITCAGKHFLGRSGRWEDHLAAEPGTGQLNPVKDRTYSAIRQVIEDVADLFPDSWFHGGGDEPVHRCWEQDHEVREYMAENNATGNDLLKMFLSKELNYIQNAKKKAVLWEDSVTNVHLPIPKNVVLQVWTNPTQWAVKKGYQIIASNANFWYLDCGHGGWSGNDLSYDEQVKPVPPTEVSDVLEKYSLSDNYNPSNWGGPGGDWCSYDLTFNLTADEAKNVLGGEVALWSEQVDETSLDTRLWPRSSAAAEILWSGRYAQDGKRRNIGDAMPRMFDWRYRLLRRGISAEALQPLWCGQNPHMCDAGKAEEPETTEAETSEPLAKISITIH
ncbi:hypothetical protein EC973_007772 [Apophysomyces ossiformis]|uniref:Beta-hexosaminidase n=1 Tax=Apophysomyces ossiformis TaxID=679940 RepID=A0A8H7EU01_9FUNG|nr:hypothetical protein EC973_007772 [Apophysomyces ossiformis]